MVAAEDVNGLTRPEVPTLAPVVAILRVGLSLQKFLVSLSYLEVYNETVRDLLAPPPPRKGEPGPSLQLKLNADGYYDVPVSFQSLG